MGRAAALHFRQSLFIKLTAGLVIATGCQRDIVPVSGRVTFNGKPLAGAVVTFQPRSSSDSPRPAGTGSIGHTDEQGHFSLRLVEPDRPGAVVGDHSVTVAAPTSAAPTSAAPISAAPTGPAPTEAAKGNPIPTKWRDGSRQFRVPPGGTKQANFDIQATEPPPAKTKPRRPR